MKTYKVIFQDGDFLISKFNGNMETAKRHWLNKSFTYWNGAENAECSRKVVKVQLIKS